MNAPSDPLPARHYFLRIAKRWGRRHLRAFAVSNVLVVVIAGVTASYPILIDWVLESLQDGAREVLFIAPPLVIVLTCFKGGALYAQTLLISRIAHRIVTDMRGDLYAALVHQDVATLSAERAGALQSRVLHDTSLLQQTFTSLSGRMIRDVATLAGLVVSMVYLDWILSLFAVVAYALAVRPVVRIGRRARQFSSAAQERTGEVASFLSEGFLATRVVKSFALEQAHIDKGRSFFEDLYRLLMAIERRNARLSPILEVGSGIMMALVIAVAGWRILGGAISVATFSGFVSAMLLALRPARALAGFGVVLQQSAAAASRVFDRLERQPTIVDSPEARELVHPRGEIRFEGVGFRYPEGGPVLRDIDLAIGESERVAIVGPSGAGKTSLVNLILRLFDPDKGRVLIDGRDLRDLTLRSLRRSIGLVAQESTVFHGTLRDNVLVGRPEADDRAVRAALAAASADFVDRLPDGLDTLVSDQGSSLSGGERQRIAIARVILRDPKILILDEPTSALDSASEDRIRDALRTAFRGRTTITIAHRLSTVVDADRIIVLNEGRIEDQGSHPDLLARSGLYRNLVKLQGLPVPEPVPSSRRNEDRRRREAEALRLNLHRRKDQARKRAGGACGDRPES